MGHRSYRGDHEIRFFVDNDTWATLDWFREFVGLPSVNELIRSGAVLAAREVRAAYRLPENTTTTTVDIMGTAIVEVGTVLRNSRIGPPPPAPRTQEK